MMTTRRWHGILLAGLLLAACAGPDANLPNLAATQPGAYQVGPGDELRLTVFGLDAMTNTYIVGDTGSIALPMLEPVPVAGRTVREVEGLVRAAILARGLVLEPRVSAQVQGYRPFYIMGEVQKPGQYPYVPGMSMMTAVSIAGGYTFRARTRDATIRRGGGSGRAVADTPVQPGDIVTIHERSF